MPTSHRCSRFPPVSFGSYRDEATRLPLPDIGRLRHFEQYRIMVLNLEPGELARAKKWKTEVPIPDPDLRARPRGGIQWQCPECGALHSSKNPGFHKRARIRCRMCKHRFRLGVGFSTKDGVLRCLYMGVWFLNMANRLNPQPLGYIHPQGRLFGKLDWECPQCKKVQTSSVNFHKHIVECSCSARYIVQLLIYIPSGNKNIVPYDWTIHDPKTYTSPSPTEISQI